MEVLQNNHIQFRGILGFYFILIIFFVRTFNEWVKYKLLK